MFGGLAIQRLPLLTLCQRFIRQLQRYRIHLQGFQPGPDRTHLAQKSWMGLRRVPQLLLGVRGVAGMARDEVLARGLEAGPTRRTLAPLLLDHRLGVPWVRL